MDVRHLIEALRTMPQDAQTVVMDGESGLLFEVTEAREERALPAKRYWRHSYDDAGHPEGEVVVRLADY